MSAGFVVGAEDEGARLDSVLAARAEVGSRAWAQRLIQAELVTVDGRPRPKRHRVSAGERVELSLGDEAPQRPEAPVDVPFDVAYEDEHLMVVDKPAGVVVHPARGHRGTTLAEALAEALAGRAAGGPAGRAGIVHRLDRHTSGLLVVARSPEAHRALEAMIRRREVERGYVALVEGRPEARIGTIEAPVGRDRADRTRVSTRTDRPREARTHFGIVEALPRTTLLEVRLETGRTHQIRAHMAAIGHPVCGDPDYGGRASGRRLGLGRQFLHAARLAFEHPLTGERVEQRSELPPDLASALEAARGEPAMA